MSGAAKGDMPAGLRLHPLFPFEIIDAMLERGPHPRPDEGRPGVIGPIASLFDWLDGLPTAFVEMAFFPRGDLPETLQPESLEVVRMRAAVPRLSDLFGSGAAASTKYVLEFGPTTVLRNPEIPFAIVLPRAPTEWEDSVRRMGTAFVVLGTGLSVYDEERVITPDAALGVLARDGGAFPAPDPTIIPGLHAVPLTVSEYNEYQPNSFILDTDVLIAIERFCRAPKPTDEHERTRQLLLNLAYRDVLPGAALSQLYQRGRKRVDAGRASRAAIAVHEVMRWDRARIAAHNTPCTTFGTGYLEEFVATAVDPAMVMMYVGLLRLRREWSPHASLQGRIASFERYIAWLRDDIQVASPVLVQVAADLLISTEPRHRQASRLLHFRAAPVGAETLDELWAAAFDVYLVSGHANMILQADMGEPVLLTFDNGLAGLYEAIRYVGIARLTSDSGTDAGFGFLQASNIDLHPQLECERPKIAEWIDQLQKGLMRRIAEERWFKHRGSELEQAADREEQLLTKQEPG